MVESTKSVRRGCEVTGCVRPHVAKGYCTLHYERLKRTGSLTARPKAQGLEDALRLYTRRDESGCLIWSGNLTERGYARTRVGGKNKYIHIAVWEAVYGPVTPGKELDHRCRVTNCVAIEHLREFTRLENVENHSGAYRNNKLGLRGVYQHKSGSYYGQVYKNKVRHPLGPFETAEAAYAATLKKRLELFTHNELDRDAAIHSA
jgi:hypothetical protein